MPFIGNSTIMMDSSSSIAALPGQWSRALQQLARCGFNAVEHGIGTWHELLHEDLWRVPASTWLAIRAEAESLNLLRSSCHAVVYGRTMATAAAIDLEFRVLDIAAALGSKVVAFHPSANRNDFYGAERWEAAIRFDMAVLHATAERAAQYGIKIAVENLPHFPLSYLTALVGRLSHPNIGYTLDTGHFNLRPETSFTSVIQRMGSRLWHLHLNGNHGQFEEHLALPGGTVPWREVFTALHNIGYDGIFLQETSVTPTFAPVLPDDMVDEVLVRSRVFIENMLRPHASAPQAV